MDGDRVAAALAIAVVLFVGYAIYKDISYLVRGGEVVETFFSITGKTCVAPH